MVNRRDDELWQAVQREQDRFQAMELDESLILSNLRLSPLERLRQHDRSLALVLALKNASEPGKRVER